MRSRLHQRRGVALLLAGLLACAPLPGTAGSDDGIDDRIEDQIEDDIADAVEDRVEDEIEDRIEDRIKERIEDRLGDRVEDRLDDRVEDAIDHHGRSGSSGHDDDPEPRIRRSGKDHDDDHDRARHVTAERFSIERLDRRQRIVRDEWVVLADRAAIDRLAAAGYRVKQATALGGLDGVVARLASPSARGRAAAGREIARLAPDAVVDFNHIYEPDAGEADDPLALARHYRVAAGDRGVGLKIGLIDTAIDIDHPALRAARITIGDFVPGGGARPSAHGTAVASILVGGDGVDGLLPGAELYAASAFFTLDSGGALATIVSLVEGLDWLAGSGVKVVNMSLSGPPNRVLAAAIAKAAEKGVLVVAAAGNGGPAAAPLYPAAYAAVVAVTAIDRNDRVYRLANRGAYIDFSAPGVLIRSAAANRRYGALSGTSAAAPFVTALIAGLYPARIADPALLRSRLEATARDLGAPGFDPIYGHGLIQPPGSSEARAQP